MLDSLVESKLEVKKILEEIEKNTKNLEKSE